MMAELLAALDDLWVKYKRERANMLHLVLRQDCSKGVVNIIPYYSPRCTGTKLIQVECDDPKVNGRANHCTSPPNCEDPDFSDSVDLDRAVLYGGYTNDTDRPNAKYKSYALIDNIARVRVAGGFVSSTYLGDLLQAFSGLAGAFSAYNGTEECPRFTKALTRNLIHRDSLVVWKAVPHNNEPAANISSVSCTSSTDPMRPFICSITTINFHKPEIGVTGNCSVAKKIFSHQRIVVYLSGLCENERLLVDEHGYHFEGYVLGIQPEECQDDRYHALSQATGCQSVWTYRISVALLVVASVTLLVLLCSKCIRLIFFLALLSQPPQVRGVSVVSVHDTQNSLLVQFADVPTSDFTMNAIFSTCSSEPSLGNPLHFQSQMATVRFQRPDCGDLRSIELNSHGVVTNIYPFHLQREDRCLIEESRLFTTLYKWFPLRSSDLCSGAFFWLSLVKILDILAMGSVGGVVCTIVAATLGKARVSAETVASTLGRIQENETTAELCPEVVRPMHNLVSMVILCYFILARSTRHRLVATLLMAAVGTQATVLSVLDGSLEECTAVSRTQCKTKFVHELKSFTMPGECEVFSLVSGEGSGTTIKVCLKPSRRDSYMSDSFFVCDALAVGVYQETACPGGTNLAAWYGGMCNQKMENRQNVVFKMTCEPICGCAACGCFICSDGKSCCALHARETGTCRAYHYNKVSTDNLGTIRLEIDSHETTDGRMPYEYCLYEGHIYGNYHACPNGELVNSSYICGGQTHLLAECEPCILGDIIPMPYTEEGCATYCFAHNGIAECVTEEPGDVVPMQVSKWVPDYGVVRVTDNKISVESSAGFVGRYNVKMDCTSEFQIVSMGVVRKVTEVNEDVESVMLTSGNECTVHSVSSELRYKRKTCSLSSCGGERAPDVYTKDFIDIANVVFNTTIGKIQVVAELNMESVNPTPQNIIQVITGTGLHLNTIHNTSEIITHHVYTGPKPGDGGCAAGRAVWAESYHIPDSEAYVFRDQAQRAFLRYDEQCIDTDSDWDGCTAKIPEAWSSVRWRAEPAVPADVEVSTTLAVRMGVKQALVSPKVCDGGNDEVEQLTEKSYPYWQKNFQTTVRASKATLNTFIIKSDEVRISTIVKEPIVAQLVCHQAIRPSLAKNTILVFSLLMAEGGPVDVSYNGDTILTSTLTGNNLIKTLRPAEDAYVIAAGTYRCNVSTVLVAVSSLPPDYLGLFGYQRTELNDTDNPEVNVELGFGLELDGVAQGLILFFVIAAVVVGGLLCICFCRNSTNVTKIKTV